MEDVEEDKGKVSTELHQQKGKNADLQVNLFLMHFSEHTFPVRARILVQVTKNRRLLIGRDGHLDQSETYDLS